MSNPCNPAVSYYPTTYQSVQQCQPACPPACVPACVPACPPATSYNPCASNYYQTAQNQCAPPCPCRQTLFKGHDEKGVLTRANGTVFSQRIEGVGATAAEVDLPMGTTSDCSNLTWIQINGSGLSIVACCYGTDSSSYGTTLPSNPNGFYEAGGYGGFDTSIAGNICSCPNTVTATVLVTLIPEPNGADLGYMFDGANGIPGTNIGQACGCITINICGGMAQGIGEVKGVYNQGAQIPTDLSGSTYKRFTASVLVTGEVCQSAGTRIVKFTQIHINQHNN